MIQPLTSLPIMSACINLVTMLKVIQGISNYILYLQIDHLDMLKLALTATYFYTKSLLLRSLTISVAAKIPW